MTKTNVWCNKTSSKYTKKAARKAAIINRARTLQDFVLPNSDGFAVAGVWNMFFQLAFLQVLKFTVDFSKWKVKIKIFLSRTKYCDIESVNFNFSNFVRYFDIVSFCFWILYAGIVALHKQFG